MNPDPTISGNPPSGTVGLGYSTTITTAGGTAPLALSLAGGTLPPGLSFDPSTGVISGNPTKAGTYSVVLQLVDSSDVPYTVTATRQIVIAAPGAALFVVGGNPPAGVVGTAYTTSLTAAGGAQPYTWAIASGALPAGLTLTPATGVISGTPTTSGTSSFTAQAQDASGATATGSFNITVTSGTGQSSPVITVSSLPDGQVGAPYNSTVGVSGGVAPYTCSLVSGGLPAGLVLAGNCDVTGVPTAAGTATVTVKATDASNPSQSTTGPVSIAIAPAPFSLGTGKLPNGTVGTPYASPVGVTGGAAPYTCTLVSGLLPSGLTLNSNCTVSGTPTVAGTATVTVKATDASNPSQSLTGPVSVTIAPTSSLNVISPPAATVGTPDTGSVGVTGGTAPYTCALRSGTLPAGLTLQSNCQITGTPTTPGTMNVVVQATDSSNPARSTSGPVTVTVNPVTTTLTLGTPGTATVGTPYDGTIPVSGGTGPYSCKVNSGTLPAGVTLGAGCSLTGTPTTAGSSTVNVTATDSANPADTTTGPVTVNVQPIQSLTLSGSLPNGTVGQPFLQTLRATGGVGPYTYATTAGALPAGLTLSSAGGISGTPTTPGASSFTVTATDSEGTPQTASLPLVLLITYPTTAADAELNGPYAFLFQGYDDVLAGVLAYQTATVGSFAADGTGVVTAGELDANHQASNPAGKTVASRNFMGTYTVGTDGRGTLTLTVLNADGTTGATSTYALALKAPVAPSTSSTQGSLIEADNDQLVGTRGSGTLLAQTPAAFAAGLKGSYAFGVSGDTPCLPTCTVGISAGPVAAVGQFTTDGAATITGGSGDANIAATNFANSTLSGSYGVADANGRVQLSLAQSNLPNTVYPTDFAAYLVDANHVFLMSTDKHSAYILQAGSAQLQTPTSFSNGSMTGNYVGYENAPTNPGLVGQTLQNVLNLSTSTLFEGTADGAGNCVTNHVDGGGTTGLINTLTGLGGSATVLQTALGAYDATGNSTCPVAADGRLVLNYAPPTATVAGIVTITGSAPAPRVAYLYNTNAGYFLETGYAGLGMLEDQVGSPFSLGTLNGTYVDATIPASSLATTNSSGVFTADGAGNAQTTLDENVGVGTINVLQVGVTGTFPYNLTDATAGRFLLGTNTVIYAIAPGRFVLLDVDPLITSPSVALLY